MTHEEKAELEYLQYFYDAVQPALGPASYDVIYEINQEYMEETGNALPHMYDDEED